MEDLTSGSFWPWLPNAIDKGVVSFQVQIIKTFLVKSSPCMFAYLELLEIAWQKKQ